MSEIKRAAYRVSEVAKMFGMTDRGIRDWIRKGILKPFKIVDNQWGRVFIPAEQVEALLHIKEVQKTNREEGK